MYIYLAERTQVLRGADLVRPLRVTQESEENLQKQLREMQQREENSQKQLVEMQQREENSQKQLKEMQQHQENSQRQLAEMQQREENSQKQLKEMQQREENSQKQLAKMQQREENSQRQLAEMQQHKENLQRQLAEMKEREENSERQLRETQQLEVYLQRQLSDIQEREETGQRKIRDLQECEEESQRQLRQMRQIFQGQVSTVERQLKERDQEVTELVLSLSVAQQTISEQQQEGTCDWVISRDEIQMTNKCLGRGGWGIVYEGVYCGCTVAVKQIHELIVSPHNIRLFEREMNIASKCRHPNLLQFVGATMDDGSPLFVTEKMEKSLRTLLEKRQLFETEITIISLDVARALCYLHQRKPVPIIHRDVSSANVLLWKQGDQWRGKVSDYGTVNFIQQTMTVAPGAMVYSAPEALTSNQTVKVSLSEFRIFLFSTGSSIPSTSERRVGSVISDREEIYTLWTQTYFRSSLL